MRTPKTSRRSIAISLAIAGLAGSACAQAQSNTQTDAQTGDRAQGPFDTIVVTASQHAQLAAKAPASISVVTPGELSTRPFTNLQDAMTAIPGVSVTGSNVNRKDISIRGMPGKYTLILVDGMRQSTRGNSHRQVTGAAQSAQIPPLPAIERIEVVRGPMSSLYGSDAIGGVINIITRKPTDQWTGALNLNATTQAHSELGDSRGGDFYVAGPLKTDVAGLQIWGQLNDRTEAKVINGAYGTRDEGATARLILTPDANQAWLVEAGWHTLKFDSGQGRTHLRPVGDLHLEFERAHYSLRHTGNWSFGTSQISLYREVGQTHHTLNGAPSRFYPANQIAHTTVEGRLNLPFGQHMLTLGAQHIDSDLDGTNHEGHNRIRGISNSSWAVYAEDEYTPTEKLALTFGLRYNDDARYGGNWSPRLYAVYELSEQLILRGGVARGFHAPGMRQTTPAYVAVTGVGHIGVPRGTLPGNPDLDPETSTSTEIGLQYLAHNGVRAGITVFNNDFTNKIFSECVALCQGTSGAHYSWGNIGKARNRGAELSVEWPFAEHFRLSADYTYIHSERLTDEEYAFNGQSLKGEPLARTPENSLDLRLGWQPTIPLSTWVALHSSSEQYWANFRNGAQWVRERPGSTTYDLGATYRFTDNLVLRAAVLNITDKRIPVDRRNRLTGLDGNWQVDNGRRFWISIGLNF